MTSFIPTASQAWALLLVAGILETAWAVGMKYTEGFSRWLPTAIVLGLAWFSFWLLALAMKVLPVGTAYAVWVGIGATGAALLGMAMLGEPVSPGRVLCIALIVAGVVGLKVLH